MNRRLAAKSSAAKRGDVREKPILNIGQAGALAQENCFVCVAVTVKLGGTYWKSVFKEKLL